MNDVQYGWVVEASQARGGGPGQGVFLSDERPVGLSDLQKARWFTDQDDARRAAYWQLGTVLSATRINDKITV